MRAADRDEINFSRYVRDVFLLAADEDYLLARISAKNGFWSHFCWSAQQCLEKYLKCYLALRDVSVRFNNRNTHSLEKLLHRAHSKTDEFSDRPLGAPMGFPINLVNEAKFEEKVSLFVSRVNNFGQTGQRYRETSYLIEPGDVHKLDILAKTLRDLCLQGKGFVGTSGRKTLHQGKWRPAQEAIPLEPKTFKENGTYRDELTYGNYEFFPEMAQKNGHTIMAHSFQLGAHERIKHRLNISEANILKLQNLGVID